MDPLLRPIGAILKSLPAEHDLDLPPAYDVPTCTYLWKLVAPEIVEAQLSIAYRDFLPALVCVDYFAHVLAGERKILDNLKYIQGEIGKRTPKPMMPLELVLVELGLRARELPKDHFRNLDVLRRYNARNTPADPTRVADPFYLGMAALLLRSVSARRASALAAARSRQEIKAVVFADAALELTRCRAAMKAIAAGDSFGASVVAAEALRDAATPELLRQTFELALGDKHADAREAGQGAAGRGSTP